jgi:hypothetical protein
VFPFDNKKHIFGRVAEISQNFICNFIKQQKINYDESIDDEDLRRFAERFHKKHSSLSKTLERNLFAIIFSTIKDHNISFIEGWNYSFDDHFTKKDFSQINQKEKRSLSYTKQFEVDTRILVDKIIDAISIERDDPKTLAFKEDLFKNLYSELFFKSKALHTYLFDKIEMEVAVETPENLLKKNFDRLDTVDFIYDNLKEIACDIATTINDFGYRDPFLLSSIEEKLVKNFINIYNGYQSALMNEIHFHEIPKQSFENGLNNQQSEHLINNVQPIVTKLSNAIILPIANECYEKQREYFKEKGYDMDNFDESQWEEFTHIQYSRNNAISSIYTAILNVTNEISEAINTKEEFAETKKFLEKQMAETLKDYEDFKKDFIENTSNDKGFSFDNKDDFDDLYNGLDLLEDDGYTYVSWEDDEENLGW